MLEADQLLNQLPLLHRLVSRPLPQQSVPLFTTASSILLQCCACQRFLFNEHIFNLLKFNYRPMFSLFGDCGLGSGHRKGRRSVGFGTVLDASKDADLLRFPF